MTKHNDTTWIWLILLLILLVFLLFFDFGNK